MQLEKLLNNHNVLLVSVIFPVVYEALYHGDEKKKFLLTLL